MLGEQTLIDQFASFDILFSSLAQPIIRRRFASHHEASILAV
jgi:hypothetical protein